jgi:imidazoleglycerol phosphate synthase glutamine amidotransferase subunit HisH
MTVVILKYNAGNICSVDYALRRLDKIDKMDEGDILSRVAH